LRCGSSAASSVAFGVHQCPSSHGIGNLLHLVRCVFCTNTNSVLCIGCYEYRLVMHMHVTFPLVFCSLGLLVGSWPLSTIMVTLLIGGVLCTGLAYFNEDTSYDTWIPTTASALDHQEWVQERFPADYRVELATLSIRNRSGSFAQDEYLAQVRCC